jgi:6-pyruvoyltetrahydropterin/6-carboxytetrahydropterin synthase
MYTVLAETEFRASHGLRLLNGGREPQHEHLWRITAAVNCRHLDSVQMGMDFHQLKALLEECTKPFADRPLEQQETFAVINPTAESVARMIYDRLAPKLPAGGTLAWIEVTEAPGYRVRYTPD